MAARPDLRAGAVSSNAGRLTRLTGWWRRVAAWPPVAQQLAAIRRANGLRFTRWAAGVALFGYLSLFPLATLAFVVVSIVLSRTPELQADVQQAITQALPGLLGTGDDVYVDISRVAQATVSAGVVGAVTLLVAGLGWVDAIVEGTRRMLGALRRPRNFLLLRLEDAGWLLLLGVLLLLALVVSVGLRTAGTELLDWLGLGSGAQSWLRAFGDLVAIVLISITLVLLFGFCWSRPQRRWRQVIPVAVVTSLVLEAMSLAVYLLVGHTLSNPVYGALAVAAALLVFLYLASAVVMYAACWLAVLEAQPPPAEEEAYYARLTGGPALLP